MIQDILEKYWSVFTCYDPECSGSVIVTLCLPWSRIFWNNISQLTFVIIQNILEQYQSVSICYDLICYDLEYSGIMFVSPYLLWYRRFWKNIGQFMFTMTRIFYCTRWSVFAETSFPLLVRKNIFPGLWVLQKEILQAIFGKDLYCRPPGSTLSKKNLLNSSPILLNVGMQRIQSCSLSLWRVVRGSKPMHLDFIYGLFIT
jgi:hypothetical protein